MNKLHPLFLALAAAGFTASALAQSPANAPVRAKATVNASSTYLITFVEPGLLYNDGQHGRFMPTTPEQTGKRKVDTRSVAAMSYRNHLEMAQDNYLAEMGRLLGRGVVPTHRYDITHNGVAVQLSEAEAAEVARIPGVSKVEREQIYELDTDAGPAFIGAPSMWNGSGTFANLPTRGQNVTIGVFDTGGNPDHPSFANDVTCGFSAGNPKLLGTKDCNTPNCATGNGEDVSFFVSDTAPGSSGHGVHTASTAAGNVLTQGTLANAVPAQFNISGVAPCAKLVTYKVCGDTAPSGAAGCGSSAITAAIQTSIVDQVDVVNFSISGGTNPWLDNDRGFLDMVNADILVAASAGNTRPATPNPVGAVNHRGPWVLTVANSTHDRVVTNPVSVVGSLQNVASQSSNGLQFTTTVTAPVANAVALGNEYGCTAAGGFAAGSMTGRIALIQRGPPAPATACGFVEKINNATAAGAIAAVIYDRTAGTPLSMDVTAAPGTTIPAVFIRQTPGYTLRDFLVANPAAQMTVGGPAQRVIDPTVSDVLNAGSLRGPNNTFDVTKPDITGPGTNIYAASSGSFGEYIFLTGTSMSSPHLAGAAALIRSAQPTWTVQEVKSAIQLTASVPGRKEDEVTPWNADDVGNGRIDLARAARSGLVMNETFARFVAANGNATLIRQLNLPSMRNTAITGSFTFTRTFRNASGVPATWTADTSGAPAGSTVTVTPSSFSFGTDTAQTQTVQITVTVNSAISTLAFGDVEFNPTPGLSDDVFASGFENAPAPDGAVNGTPTPQMPFPARLTLAVRGNP